MHYWSLNIAPYVESFNWGVVLSWFAVVVIGFIAYCMARFMAKNL
jgi:putative exporter of polyketide antibiotics